MEPTTDFNPEAAAFCAGRFELRVEGVALRLLCVREFFIQNFNHETHHYALAYQQSFECLRTWCRECPDETTFRVLVHECKDDSGWLVTLDAELVRRTDWDLPMRGFTRFDFDPYIRLAKLRLLLD